MAGSPRISDQAVYDLTSYSHCSFITNYRIKSLLKTLKSLEVEAVTPRGCLTGSSLRLARTTITANYCLATTAPPPASASTLAEVLWPGASDLWEYQRDQPCWNISFEKFLFANITGVFQHIFSDSNIKEFFVIRVYNRFMLFQITRVSQRFVT